MAKIHIQRTAAFAWSPDTAPFIATGTQAGAVAADFSDDTRLELWDLDLAGNAQTELSPVASVNTDSKCVLQVENSLTLWPRAVRFTSANVLLF
jgi:protein transport protein SEC31